MWLPLPFVLQVFVLFDKESFFGAASCFFVLLYIACTDIYDNPATRPSLSYLDQQQASMNAYASPHACIIVSSPEPSFGFPRQKTVRICQRVTSRPRNGEIMSQRTQE